MEEVDAADQDAPIWEELQAEPRDYDEFDETKEDEKRDRGQYNMSLTPEQHAGRRTGIGGSDAPICVLGECFGKTIHDLWLEKTGRISPADLDSPDIRRGIRQEPVAVAIYQEKTGHEVVDLKKTIRHPRFDFMVANIDRLIKPGDDVLEIKCPRLMVFRRWQLEGIPEYVQIQGQHYCEVLNSKRVVFGVFCAELDELLCVPVERDNDLISMIVDKETRFWNMVKADIDPGEPIPDHSNIPTLPPIGGELVRIETEEWRKAAFALQEAKELKSEADALEEDAKERIRTLMADSGVAEGWGLRAYNREQAGRTTYDMKMFQKMNPHFDLSPYRKQGAPFRTLKTYFLKGATTNGE